MLSVRVKPETFEVVQAIARQRRISQGEVIDELLSAKDKHPSKMQGAILAYLVPVQTSALSLLEIPE